LILNYKMYRFLNVSMHLVIRVLDKLNTSKNSLSRNDILNLYFVFNNLNSYLNSAKSLPKYKFQTVLKLSKAKAGVS